MQIRIKKNNEIRASMNIAGRESKSHNDGQNSVNTQASAFFQDIVRNVEQSIENSLHSQVRCFKCNSENHRSVDWPEENNRLGTPEKCTKCRCIGHPRRDCAADMSKDLNKKRVYDFNRREKAKYEREQHSRKKFRCNNNSTENRNRRAY